jgi:hypothetical protein
MSFIASDDNFPSGFYGQGFGPNTILGSLVDNDLINTGITETNVTVVQSNVFFPGTSPNFVSNTGIVQYDARFLASNDLLFTCDNYLAVCLINVTQFFNGTINPVASFVDCDCYNRNGNGNLTGVACEDVGDDNVSYAIGSHEFQGGSSSLFSGTLNNVSVGQAYVVQYISGQKTNDGCFNDSFPRADVGGLIDNVRNVETFLDFIICDGTLTGDFNAFLTDFLPTQFAGQFNTVGDDGVGGDAIMMNFADEYLPNYRTLGAFVTAEIGIFDDFEDFQSCGDVLVCFIRLGIDADVPISDEFSPSPITSPPTSTPPTTITPPPPTSVPPSNGGGGGSCAIAASPVQLGTAFANVLIPLVPVAFAFGVRAVRRRKK